MITPGDREAGLSMAALLTLQAWGGEPPQPMTGATQTMTGQLRRLGWRILPIPSFASEVEGVPPVANFHFIREWLIVPPDDSPIRARKVEGKICAIRVAWRLATFGDDAAQPGGEG